MLKRTLLGAALAVIGLLGTNLQAANAQNFWNLLQNSLGAQGGQAGDFNMIQNNVHVGLSNLTNQINAGASSGQLHPGEVSHFHAQVSNLAAQNANNAADGVYSTAEVSGWLAQLNSLTQQVNSAIAQNNQYNSNFGYGYPFGGAGAYGNPYFNDFNGFLNYRNDLQRQINAARVSQFERNQWRKEYNELARRVNRQNFKNKNNKDLKQLVKLKEKIRKHQQIASPDSRRWR